MAENANQPESSKEKRSTRVSQTDVPSVSLQDALRIPIALRDNYSLDPATPVDVGVAIGIAPTSGRFRAISGAALAYGLTTAGGQGAEIGVTDLGRRVVAPTTEGDDAIAKIEAFEKPRVIREFVEKYNGNRLPGDPEITKNVLAGMGVPRESTQRVYDLITVGLAELGYLRDVNGTMFVQRPKPGPIPAADDLLEEDAGVDGIAVGEDRPLTGAPVPPPQSRPNAIFLGHGKNKKPLEQLIKILDEYGIPHKEAVGEANAGRPIPIKVAETMRDCGAAILIFTADEKLFDADGAEVWRPSENVVHELGASSVLYDNRIIIFKESGVDLASNFSSIGYIPFEKDKLSDKGIDLFRELVSFKIVSISVGGSSG